MLKNYRVTAFTFSYLLRENQQGLKLPPPPPPSSLPSLPRLGLNVDSTLKDFSFGAVELTKNSDLDK